MLEFIITKMTEARHNLARSLFPLVLKQVYVLLGLDFSVKLLQKEKKNF